MKIETGVGKIEIKESSDGVNKGVWIEVNGIGLVLVEHDTGKDKHVIRVWNNDDPDNDYEYIQVIESKEVTVDFLKNYLKANEDYELVAITEKQLNEIKKRCIGLEVTKDDEFFDEIEVIVNSFLHELGYKWNDETYKYFK